MENINKTIHTYTTENVVLYDPLMISANTNTVLRALDFNQENKLVAYSAANTILIMDPYYTSDQSDSQDQQKQVPRVLFSLKGHSDRVNSVQWINSNTLVSISSDKSLIIWGFEGENGRLPENWTFKKIYQNAHDTDINYLRTYKHEQNNELYVHSMCRDGTLKVWQGTSRDNIQYRDQLIFGKNLQEALGVVEFGEKHLMVVLGGYDAKIHVYLFPTIQHQNSEAKSLFKYKVSLPGHMDALRDYDFTPFYVENQVRYLASSSQDNYIRLWKIQPLDNISQDHGGHLDDDLQKYEKVLSLQSFCLLSSSFDFTVSVWKSDATGLWQVDSTLGAMAGNKHAFFGAIFMKDDQQILAYTYNGGMNRWDKEQIPESDSFKWSPQLTVKGHFGEVTDMDWDQYETNLITCSQDQTTRLFSRYGNDFGWFEFTRPQIHGYDMNTLAVLSMNSKAGNNLPSRILSGGDEKVLRLFEAPYSFVKIYNQLNPDSNQTPLRYSDQNTNEEVEALIGEEAAKKQPLGLMNKPTLLMPNQKSRVDEEDGGMNAGEFDPTKYLSNTQDAKTNLISDKDLRGEPPLEDILMTRTLWPEQQKLYGHAFEIFAVATSHRGDCAASSCKAKEKKYADIIIWDLTKQTTTVPSCRLVAHNLTVVQLEFSKCDQYLLSCSRDRSWAIFKRESEGNGLQFSLVRRLKDAHTRIIWGVSWSHDDLLFATASREKQKSVKIFKGISNEQELNSQIQIIKDSKIGDQISELPEEQNQNATAIRFLPSLVNGVSKYALCVGLESGEIIIWKADSEMKQWARIFDFPAYYQHSLSVKRIKFNARYSNPKNDEYTVATCGGDHTVKLFKFQLINGN
eukprot:403376473